MHTQIHSAIHYLNAGLNNFKMLKFHEFNSKNLYYYLFLLDKSMPIINKQRRKSPLDTPERKIERRGTVMTKTHIESYQKISPKNLT